MIHSQIPAIHIISELVPLSNTEADDTATMTTEIDTGDLINFSHSPPHTPITSRSTSFTHPQPSNSPYEDKWPTLQPKQISMWSTNNWAPITAQAPVAAPSQVKVNQSQVADQPGPKPVDQPRVEIEEKTFDGKGKGKEKEVPPSSPSSSINQSRPVTAAEPQKQSPMTRPSPLQLKNTNHITSPSIEYRRDIPLPASPYNSSGNLYSPSINSGKNIPLPSSPYTSEAAKLDSPSIISGKNIPLPPSTYVRTESDAQSIHSFNSDETTQSKLSASAKPFEATPRKRIDVIRKSDPPTFFTPTSKESNSWEQTPTPHSPDQSGSDVSADQMDPAYYDPGYGGHAGLISTASRPKSPTWFARPQSRVVSISSPVSEKVKPSKEEGKEKQEEVPRPSTPITSDTKVYDGTADSPISNREMREVTPMSPSQTSSDDDPDLCKLEDISFADDEPNSPSELWLGEVDVDAGHISEPIERITAHLSSISLSPSERSFNSNPHAVPPHPTSEPTPARSGGSNPYIQARHGRLTPEHDRGSGDEKYKSDIGQYDRSRSSEDDIGLDTTLVSEGLFDLSNSLDELDEIENAWLQFRDGYGAFSGSIDEALARLKREMTW